MKYYRDSTIKIVVPIPEDYHDCLRLIKSDYYRIRGKEGNLFQMYSLALEDPTFRFLFWHRLSQVKGWLWLYAKFRHRQLMYKYGLMIASSTKIGYGLTISHPHGVIINHTAVIGNNVNLSHFSTIGSNEIRAAVIGDNVYIGPSVSIIENVHIGSNATIGAGSIVTKDVKADAVVAGNPAREINAKVWPGKYINNRYPLPKECQF